MFLCLSSRQTKWRTEQMYMGLNSHTEQILWSEDQILRRVSELASLMADDFRSSSPPPVFLGVATGAFLFFADLVRKIDLPNAVAQSYGSGTDSNGGPAISFDLKVDVQGRHVVLLERCGVLYVNKCRKIFVIICKYKGHTLSSLIALLKSKGASSISVCTFLDKPARRKVDIQLVGQGKFYRGFECPDYFVVGCGMDFAELYRNLPTLVS